VTAQPRALPNLVPVLVERWRALVAEFEGLASNPNAEPGELDEARRLEPASTQVKILATRKRKKTPDP
jgi:hypothetical protein